MPKAVALKRPGGETKEKKKPRKRAKKTTQAQKNTEPLETIKLKPYPSVGELLFCGGTNWDLTGRWKLPKSATRDTTKIPAGGRNLLGPHRLSALSGIRVRNVISGPHANHSILITEEGKAMSWGRNELEQLGLGHSERVDSPTLIDTLKNKHIVNAACGRTHTLCLTDEGSVYAFGDNRLGQLGIGCQSASVATPCKIDYRGYPIVQVACGGEFSMILDCKGSLHSFGSQEYSQLGHNSNGRFAVKGSKTSSQNITSPRKVVLEKLRDGTVKPLENTVMKDVVCGGNHTVAMDMQSRIFTWGFGGYGRLGHGEPKDEPVPRSIKFFEPQMSNRTASKIYAGSSYSMVICTNGQLYFWGQTKSTGEATMYPKPLNDLSGWNIRSIGCSNSSIVIAAEESIISWGPSPTYGELGYGENMSKSCTYPQKAKPLESIHVFKVACGMGHSLMIARDEKEDDKVRLSKIPIFDPRMAQSIPGTPYVPKPAPVVEEAEKEEEATEGKEEETKVATEAANGSATVEQEAAKPDPVETKSDSVETKPGTVLVVANQTESSPQSGLDMTKPVGGAPDVFQGGAKEPIIAPQTGIKSANEVVATTQETITAKDEPTEPMDMSMPAKAAMPPQALAANGVPEAAAATVPSPSNEPLNLTMGSAGMGGQAATQPAAKNNLPPPPATSAAQTVLTSEQEERTSCIKVVTRDGVVQPSSNGAISP